ncbi:hypothetical protein H4R19_003894 [Coemansia spiralis]|nr:hypothetical protein H4R19_003894 [Coemansia spiralis]
MNCATSLLPVNLCVYCVVYLQLVMIHNVSLELRWPRVVALTTATLLSVVPPSIFLYITPRAIGRKSYCDFHLVPSSKEYGFAMYSYFAWAYLPGVIGTISVLTIAVYIWRTRRATRRALQASAEHYGPSQAVERVGHTDTLHHALLTIIWFPITPIISMWFNAANFSIRYYKKRVYSSIEIANVLILCLQSLLLGLPLLVNPTVRAALAKQLQEQREARHGTHSTTHNHSDMAPPPPLLLRHDTDQEPKPGQPADC